MSRTAAALRALRSPGAPRPLEWLYIAGGLALVYRYYWLMDDAFVYFRYVDNLLFLGNGLVFNAGEYVEGFTSPAWLLLLAGLRATGMHYETAVRLVAAPAFLAFGLLLVRLNRALSPAGAPTANLPLAYLAFHYGVSCYFTSGVETPLLQVLAIAYGLFVLNPGSRPLTLALAVSPLVRPELAAPLLLAGAWAWWRRGHFPAQLALATGALVGAWLLFRIYYYADLLPNPFYLKDTAWYAQGLRYLANALVPYAGHVLLPLAAIAGAVLARRGALPRGAERLAMLALALPVLLYVVRIGGDARHYRYLAFPICLGIGAAGGVAEAWLARIGRGALRRAAAPAAGIGLALLSLSAYPPQLKAHPLRGGARARFVHRISDAAYHRHTPLLASYPRWRRGLSAERLRAMRDAGFRYRWTDAEGPCANFYRRIDVRGVLKMGLTQPFLARVEMRHDRPGHKLGLVPLAHDLVELYGAAPELDRGMFRRAVEEGRAPDWVARNLGSLEVIEKKVFNRHDPWENLRLAFRFPDRIVP